jgi:imidazolonepropionase-like amidohydrolase
MRFLVKLGFVVCAEGQSDSKLRCLYVKYIQLPPKKAKDEYSMKKLLTSAAMIDGIKPELIKPAAILVDSGRITELGESATIGADQDTEVVDFGRSVLMPGLIDSHVHLVASGKPGALTEISEKSDLEIALQGAANMAEALRAGITTVRDCGGVAEVVLALREASRSGLLPGPRIIASGAPVTTTGGHCHYFRLEAEGRTEILQAMRRMHKLDVDFFKVMVTGGGSTPGSNPSASQYSGRELTIMAEEAHRLGRKITGHAHGTEGITLAMDAGFDGLEHCSWLDRSGAGIHYDENLVKIMVDRKTVICRTIAGFERWNLEQIKKKHPANNNFESFRKMVIAGVPIIAGTDAGIDETNFAGLCTTLETMVGLGGMDEAAVIDSATRAAAAALDCGEDLGTLEIGKIADIIAVNENPYVDIRTLRNVAAVIQNGSVVYQYNELEQN